MSFSPVKEDDVDILAAVDWNQTLTFYDITGKQVCILVVNDDETMDEQDKRALSLSLSFSLSLSLPLSHSQKVHSRSFTKSECSTIRISNSILCISSNIFFSICCPMYTLNLYGKRRKKIAKEKQLGFDPLSVHFFSKGEYLLVGGSNKQALMYSKEGVLISSLCELSSWIWSCKPNPSGTHIVSTFS